ncbi:uncharacterized protein [Eurosta solidaginis]|uniref:uncharacterized protein n=1 Tax=Eurosta solidaginis TaxID=178769 RepID=UPI003530F83B
MEKHPHIAKGFIKGDKLKVDALWAEVVVELNEHGPPHKDISGWKKVWIDWKAFIKRKLVHNSKEARATGGGPYNKYVLTPTEDAIARLCNLITSVKGVPNTKDYGAAESDTPSDSSSDDDQPSTSRAAALSRSRRSEPSATDCLKANIDEQTKHMKNIVNGLKGCIEATVYVSGAVETLCEAVKATTTAIREGNAERKRHHLEMERQRQTENELKQKENELTELKIHLKYNKSGNNN